MFDTIVHTSSPITLVGGGSVTKRDLKLAASLAPVVVAADGGAHAAAKAGFSPTAVIGDLDSFDPSQAAGIPSDRIHRIADQDTTDFEKCLASLKAPAILAVGFTGGRMDHHLAVCSALMRFAHVPCIVLGQREVMFHCPRQLALSLDAGDILSLFPLAAVTGRSTGLRWPIDDLTLRPGARIGTSNEATGGEVTIEVDSDGLLAILPRRHLGRVMSALRQS